MSNQIIDKLVIIDEEDKKMVLEQRMIEGDDFLVIDIGGQTIFLNEQADLIALVKYIDKQLSITNSASINNTTNKRLTR